MRHSLMVMIIITFTHMKVNVCKKECISVPLYDFQQKMQKFDVVK